MKQTAVEWYEKQIWSLQLQLEKKEISIGIYALKRVELFEQAKEMEKQQIIKAREALYPGTPEQYYNETFKSE